MYGISGSVKVARMRVRLRQSSKFNSITIRLRADLRRIAYEVAGLMDDTDATAGGKSPFCRSARKRSIIFVYTRNRGIFSV